jgi:nitrate reductase gamma subunit
MMDILDKTKRYLWAFVEIGFAGVLAIMLIYLILGQSSGVFVLAVADNVMKFANAVPTPSLIGFALILGLIYLIMNRLPRP